MNFKTLLALVCGIVIQDSSVSAAPSQPPFQARLHYPLLKKIFHKRDQVVLNIVKDMKLVAEDDAETKFADLVASVVPAGGVSQDDFDFDLKVTKEYLGAETDKLEVSGSGKYDGVEFTFTAPVSLMKLKYTMGDTFHTEMKINTNVFKESQWSFDVIPASLTVSGADLSDDSKVELLKKLTDKVDDIKSQAVAGKEEIVPEFPMDAIVPFVGMFYGSQFAETVTMNDDHVGLAYSLKHLEMLTPKQNDLLKPIEGEFYGDQNAKGQNALFQVLLDDNFFNSLTSVFVSVDKMFSYRELAKGNPKMAPTTQMLTTSTLGTVLPQFVEDYGADKKIDVAFSPSHDLFKEGFPGSKMTGMYMDKNGNWKMQVNVAASINVETFPGVWDSARELYVTFVFKYKQTTDDSNPFNKQFVFLPKNVEISQLKVMKGDEEMTTEQMMIQSMANIQFEQLKKTFVPYPVSLGDILAKNPKELQCFGFNVADIDISFKKSQVQFSAYYKDIDISKADKEVCAALEEQLRQSPAKVMEQLQSQTDEALGGKLHELKEKVAPAPTDDKEAAEEKPSETVHDEL